MDLLLHTCCAPCSLLSRAYFEEEQQYKVTGYFYNPNIHPFREFRKRKEALRELARQDNMPLLSEDEYPLEFFLQNIVGRENDRCRICYEIRLEKTAQKAKEQGSACFSSTLLISPYQDQVSIERIGRTIAQRQGVSFIYRDLRHLFQESMALARRRGIYTQGYCGCIYSEKERYYK